MPADRALLLLLLAALVSLLAAVLVGVLALCS
jgi:hypothetical protein